MKKFLMGFLTGMILFTSIGVIAAVTYIANPVDFKVIVNGEEFVSDPPALEVDGRTYLPLRAIGDVLGVPVSWNEKLRQAEVGTMSEEIGKGYKTYIESESVVDFGNFCGVEEAKEKEAEEGYVSYYYDWDVDVINSDVIIEYLELMERYGYTIKRENDTFYYGMNYEDLDKNTFSMTFGKENGNFYVIVSVFK